MHVSQAGAGSLLVILVALATFIAMICHIIAFSTDYWLVSDGKSAFLRIGFHRACFEDCRNPYCPSSNDQVIYNDCYGINDFYFRDITKWLKPDWYMHVRNMTIVNVPLTFICCVLTIIAAVIVGVWRYPRSKSRTRYVLLLAMLALSATAIFAAAVLALVTLGQFYMNSFNYGWMPMPYKNHLGYSYWLEVVTCIMLMMALMGCVVSFVFKMLHMYHPHEKHGADDMMMGRGFEEESRGSAARY